MWEAKADRQDFDHGYDEKRFDLLLHFEPTCYKDPPQHDPGDEPYPKDREHQIDDTHDPFPLCSYRSGNASSYNCGGSIAVFFPL